MSLSASPLVDSCIPICEQPTGVLVQQALTHLVRGLLQKGIRTRIDPASDATPLEQIEIIQEGLTLQPVKYVKPTKGGRPPFNTIIRLEPNPESIDI